MAKNWYPVIDILTCAECVALALTFVRMACMTNRKPLSLLLLTPPLASNIAGAIAYVGDNGDTNGKSGYCCSCEE